MPSNLLDLNADKMSPIISISMLINLNVSIQLTHVLLILSKEIYI